VGRQSQCGCENDRVSDRPLRNPVRSEADAFRLLVLIGLGVAAIVVAAALGGALVGVPVAVILIGLAIRASFRWTRQQVAAPDDEGGRQAP
jgi:hypothetical protein